MKILFITAHPYLPQMYGGLQTSTDELCHTLIARGCQVAILGALLPDGWLGIWSRIKLKLKKKLTGFLATRDMLQGYPVWRAWFPWLAVQHVIAQEKPDLIVVLAVQPVKMALAAKPAGIPILIQLQDVEFSQHGGAFEELGKVAAVANSHFTARTYRDAYGIEPTVIVPFIAPEKYRTVSTRENVTFINPHSFKGLHIALGIVRLCPDIPFVFVESWPLKDHELKELHAAMALLPNLTLLKPQQDMRDVYGKCKILLAPSLWSEGYGRVATEAQLSGIPVVASDRGGLPEAVGPGGVLLSPDDPLEKWAVAIHKLWQDDAYYAQMSKAALDYVGRPEIDITHHMELWEAAIKQAIHNHA